MIKQHMRNVAAALTLMLIVMTQTMTVTAESFDTEHRAKTRMVIFNAMNDEMNRNVERLSLEGMEKPFFISYTVNDVRSAEVVATLGSIVKSEIERSRTHGVRVLVGNYALNDENFSGMSSYRSSMIHGSNSLPLDDDYDGIRRALWIATDDTYKRAAELFEHKKASLKQQTENEYTRIDDFSRVKPVNSACPIVDFNIDTSSMEEAAKTVSGVFREYPEIYSSRMRFFVFRGETFLTSTEGTRIVRPLTVTAIQINAYTQAEDGEPLSDHLSWYCIEPDELPDTASLAAETHAMAKQLTEMRTAPVFDDSYFGPVLLEDQSTAEFFAQRLFTGKKGLIASREPISENSGFGYGEREETLEDRLERRILSRDLSVKDLPGTTEYGGTRLLGAYDYDLEGVKVPESLTLVENGILKTLLTNRTPTLKIPESNGHFRPVIGGGPWASATIAPGVVSVESSAPLSRAELKQELLKHAKEEGLDYGIIVRKLKPRVTGAKYYDPMVRMTASYGRNDGMALSPAIAVYRVSVKDGTEEALRSVKLGSVSLSALRHIVGVSGNRTAVNTLVSGGWNSGVPGSLIVPDTVLLEELEVKKEKRDYTPRLPAVPSPLAGK